MKFHLFIISDARFNILNEELESVSYKIVPWV